MLLGPEHILVLNLQWHPRHLQNKGSQPALSTRLSPSPSKATFTATVPFPSIYAAILLLLFDQNAQYPLYRNQSLLVKNPIFWNPKRMKRRVLACLLSTYYMPPTMNLP